MDTSQAIALVEDIINNPDFKFTFTELASLNFVLRLAEGYADYQIDPEDGSVI